MNPIPREEIEALEELIRGADLVMVLGFGQRIALGRDLQELLANSLAALRLINNYESSPPVMEVAFNDVRDIASAAFAKSNGAN